jgi:hypothetical protein
MGEGDSALAETFEHHDVERAALGQIDGWIETVGGKAGTRSDAQDVRAFVHGVAGRDDGIFPTLAVIHA